jgi:hypothetical protein
LVAAAIGITRSKRPGQIPKDLARLEHAGSRWMVGDPNEQRVVARFHLLAAGPRATLMPLRLTSLLVDPTVRR